MRVCPLLHDLPHRAKIMPVRIALEWELSIAWEFNPVVYGRPAQPFWYRGPLSHEDIYCGPQTFCDVTNPLILVSFMR